MAKERLFRFKKFALSHSISAMKVGTDAVSLGAWAQCSGRVLDVGCGCGIIGIMAAQRGAVSVEMIDIDSASVSEATENAAECPWADAITVRSVNFLECTGQFDAILSNPPFFAAGILAPDLRRAAARHESDLTPDAFMQKAAELLSDSGRVSIIIPPDRLASWQFAAEIAQLFPEVICHLLTKEGAEPRRIMATFSRRKNLPTIQQLAINSPQYKLLTEDFYL